MRPAPVGTQSTPVLASILVDDDRIASVIALVKHFIPAQVDTGPAYIAGIDIYHGHLAAVSLLHGFRLYRSGGSFGRLFPEKCHDCSSLFCLSDYAL